MDRFIVVFQIKLKFIHAYLKSNMDRFIDYDEFGRYVSFFKFKIQYG